MRKNDTMNVKEHIDTQTSTTVIHKNAKITLGLLVIASFSLRYFQGLFYYNRFI